MERAALIVSMLVLACAPADPSGYEPGEERSGGDTTVFDTSRAAYSISARNLTFDERSRFLVGNNFFGDNWVVAPSSTSARDGLGPLHNALSCGSCHLFDGRGEPPGEGEEMVSMLVRLSVPGQDAHGGPLGEPTYGGQLQPRAIPGVPAEGATHLAWEEVPGAYEDGEAYSLRRPILTIDTLAYGPMHDDVMTSARVAPPVYGLGLLEAVPDATLLALADPNDADGDGISGRINHVWDAARGETAIGRFGWKATQPSIHQQTAGAFLGDLGITTSLFPSQECSEREAECRAATTGGEPECEDDILDFVVFYGQTLAVPARRDADDPDVLHGKRLFRDAGCASCHVPRLETGEHEITALADQIIYPYTDMLLHDVGEGLADHRPDFEADGREWRTPPLWGIGLLQTVNRHQLLMHDGRARGLAEAILWHGGEAEASREAFRAMSRDEREALLRFLESL
ncbi:di-heme oxidoredictase family protein [Sandaracinus amylolyticus]|uniref:Putative thiol oxidoreductase with 2 cytochrome c heme-binding site n=1 Tax=Sandaracinus amylolyticus TaxID=927083 RepID=A0A0F6W5J2_9BACT|nr:di-heme oxidoredictase family protein [Sandaracinus amylolyticus]AKF08025.1 Putative thiol oxidoreductase with 2 cytochrome c heme-binding site [Sandaracinus amylolyticus]